MRNKPKRRDTFEEHCSKGLLLGTVFKHYRSWIMWINDTRAMRISSTVFHKHKNITNLDSTPKDRVISAAGKLAYELNGCMPPHLSETTLKQLERIGTILKQGRTQTVQHNPHRTSHNPPPPLPRPTLHTSQSESCSHLHH